MKLLTEIKIERLPVEISVKDKIMVVGSCFADNIGDRMKDCGFDCLVNPFGTLYNPASILSALERLQSGTPFTENDCIEMGAGAGLICSFHHHTSFAGKTPEEFLERANSSLKEAHDFWMQCNKLIITLGTSYVWKYKKDGSIVSNCLKRPSSEFFRTMLGIEQTTDCLKAMKDFGKEIILTVSPIRHLSDGAHSNTLSKAALQIAVSSLSDERTAYFPAYEIMMDELRDYRFYAEDLVHPSPAAASYIWERFVEAAVPKKEHPILLEKERLSRRMRHVEMH